MSSCLYHTNYQKSLSLLMKILNLTRLHLTTTTITTGYHLVLVLTFTSPSLVIILSKVRIWCFVSLTFLRRESERVINSLMDHMSKWFQKYYNMTNIHSRHIGKITLILWGWGIFVDCRFCSKILIYCI